MTDDQMADGQIGLGLNGQRPIGTGPNGRGGHLRQMTPRGSKVQPSLKWLTVILKFDLRVCKCTPVFMVILCDKVRMYEEIMTNDDNLESNLPTSSLLKMCSLYELN